MYTFDQGEVIEVSAVTATLAAHGVHSTVQGLLSSDSLKLFCIQLLALCPLELLMDAQAFIKSWGMILLSEIGDKTFFIAAIMAMRNSRRVVHIQAD